MPRWELEQIRINRHVRKPEAHQMRGLMRVIEQDGKDHEMFQDTVQPRLLSISRFRKDESVTGYGLLWLPDSARSDAKSPARRRRRILPLAKDARGD